MRIHLRARVARLCLLLLAVLAGLLVPSSAFAAAGAPSGAGIQPVEVTGNRETADCPAGTFGLTVQGGALASNPHTLGGFSVTTATSNTGTGQVLSFTANMGVDVVFVKGGPNTNVYTYTPERSSDTGLHAPLGAGPGGTKYFDISHVTFCVDFELQVTKTATTSFTRDYDWQIDKRNDQESAPVQVAPGQQFTVNYDVVLTAGTPVDSDHRVSGAITVTNPAPVTAGGVSVTDVIKKTGDPDIAAAVDCGGVTTIAAGQSIQCTYAADLPDGSARTNEATATSTTTGINAGTGTAAVTFGSPTTTTGACVDVTDDKTTGTPAALGEACVNESPKTFEYSLTFGPFANTCEQHTFTNVAAFKADDDQEGSDTSTVVFDVQCIPEGGCTLTQGYWKTHSDRGPAPYDEAWKNLGPLEESTLFFNTGRTWYDVFWMPPQGGNAFLILAHQYQAARLNQLDGASVPAGVQTALTAAADLLDNYSSVPARITDRAVREQMLALAGTLGSYNEGATGPGHCDEDAGSSRAP